MNWFDMNERTKLDKLNWSRKQALKVGQFEEKEYFI